MELQTIKQRFGIIGNSSALNHSLTVASNVAPTDLTVLITGESGVGKEVFSQIIHQLSPRKHNGLIAVNCGAIPEGTIDSELFGHEKGSFTGAHESRKGYFETVNGGTIFLDEIGELPLGTQARLLRVLESGEFIKVGSSKVQKTDVRLIAATNSDLRDAIGKGKFREDLFYRLNTVPITVPPLRERKEDIPVLFRKFCVDFGEKYRTSSIQLTDEAKDLLINYNFPGNVRELKNLAEQISVLAKEKIVGTDELINFIPKITMERLPILSGMGNDGNNSERELLYKLFFEMKRDLTDIKKFMFEVMQHGNFSPSNFQHFPEESPKILHESTTHSEKNLPPEKQVKPLIIDSPIKYNEETVEESLSLVDKEKEFIIRALKKHKGRRNKAAQDLGISERTLYRKIKEYEISDKL